MAAPHIERMGEELVELSGRINRLSYFLERPLVPVAEDERERMTRQLGHMVAYRDVLVERLKAAGVDL